MLFPLRLQQRSSDISRRPLALAPLDAAASPATERVERLLDAAATLDLDDRAAWSRLHAAARKVIGALIADDRLPDHLAIGPDDPPVLISRTLAAARRHVTDPRPSQPSGDGSPLPAQAEAGPV